VIVKAQAIGFICKLRPSIVCLVLVVFTTALSTQAGAQIDVQQDAFALSEKVTALRDEGLAILSDIYGSSNDESAEFFNESRHTKRLIKHDDDVRAFGTKLANLLQERDISNLSNLDQIIISNFAFIPNIDIRKSIKSILLLQLRKNPDVRIVLEEIVVYDSCYQKIAIMDACGKSFPGLNFDALTPNPIFEIYRAYGGQNLMYQCGAANAVAGALAGGCRIPKQVK